MNWYEATKQDFLDKRSAIEIIFRRKSDTQWM